MVWLFWGSRVLLDNVLQAYTLQTLLQVVKLFAARTWGAPVG
jgi:hypothetical protein